MKHSIPRAFPAKREQKWLDIFNKRGLLMKKKKEKDTYSFRWKKAEFTHTIEVQI